MKKVLPVLIIVFSLLIVSCAKDGRVMHSPELDELALNQIAGRYEVEDMSDLGF